MNTEHETKIQRYEAAPKILDRLRAQRAIRPATLDMQESTSLLSYWRVLRKRRWTVMTVLAVLFTLVLVGTLKETPIYQSGALLEIEKENPNILSVQELFQLDTVSDTYLETQYKILESDTLARQVIVQLRLDLLPEFNSKAKRGAAGAEELGGQTAPPDPLAVERALGVFQDRLSVEPVKLSRLVAIRFESSDPELAARIVSALAQADIEENLRVRWDATQRASEWLTQQLDDLKGRLEKSEDQMQAYAQANGLLYLQDDKGTEENIVDERLRQLQEELTKAQADRYQKESLYRLVQAGQIDALPGVADNKLIEDLTEQLTDIEKQKAQLETTFTADYPKVRELQNQEDKLSSVIERERQRAADQLTNDYQAAVQREDLVQQAFTEQQKDADQIASRSVQYNILKREVDTNRQLYEGLLERLKETGVSAGLKASNIRVVDEAVAPRKAARPNLPLNLALALVLGLGLGVGGAFLQEHLDNSLKSSEDIERYLGLPALALIPSVESLNGQRHGVYGLPDRAVAAAGSESHSNGSAASNGHGENGHGENGHHRTADGVAKSWYRIAGGVEPPAALGEAFRGLRTSVMLSSADRPPRTLLVSSPRPSEGKTTVSVNLAISLAQLNQRVLIIDGDMRRPSIRKALGLANGLGLVSYLTGQKDWREAVMPSGVENLDALVCGPVPPNPAELLSSDRMRVMLEEARGEYQFVVVDSPPLLNVSDSRILATLVEGVILVVKGGTTPRELAQRAQSYAEDVGANLIGVVLNNLDVRAGDDYYRYYRYDYYGEDEKPGRSSVA
ncbi:MAG: polysaccharide biosynthesis tyrosine autokinase [Candidatus Acidiferrales bacterium]